MATYTIATRSPAIARHAIALTGFLTAPLPSARSDGSDFYILDEVNALLIAVLCRLEPQLAHDPQRPPILALDPDSRLGWELLSDQLYYVATLIEQALAA